MHLAALLRNAFLPLRVIIFELTIAAAVPTARPMPMPLTMDIFFDDENILFSLQSLFLIFILSSEGNKTNANIF